MFRKKCLASGAGYMKPFHRNLDNYMVLRVFSGKRKPALGLANFEGAVYGCPRERLVRGLAGQR